MKHLFKVSQVLAFTTAMSSFTGCGAAMQQGLGGNGSGAAASFADAVTLTQDSVPIVNGQDIDQLPAETIMAIAGAGPRARSSNIGPRKIAHILLEFTNHGGSYFPANYKNDMLQTMTGLKETLEKSAFGQLQLTIDTLGPFQISSEFSSLVGCYCPNGHPEVPIGIAELQARANLELMRIGVDLANYDYAFYHFAPDPANRCSGANAIQNGGIANFFDTYNDAWNGNTPLSKFGVVFQHEFGHMAGASHNADDGPNHTDPHNFGGGWYAMGLIQAGNEAHGVGTPFNMSNLISMGWVTPHTVLDDGALIPAPGGRIYRIYSASKLSPAGERALRIPVSGTTNVLHVGYTTSESDFHSNMDSEQLVQDHKLIDAVNVTIAAEGGGLNQTCLRGDNSLTGVLLVEGQEWNARDLGIGMKLLHLVNAGPAKYAEVLVYSTPITTADLNPPTVQIMSPIQSIVVSGSYSAPTYNAALNEQIVIKVAATDDDSGVAAVRLAAFPFAQDAADMGAQLSPGPDGYYTFTIDDSAWCDGTSACAYSFKAYAYDKSGGQGASSYISIVKR